MPYRVRRVATLFGEGEFKDTEAYCTKHKLSVYALVKEAVREFIEKHP